MGKENKKFGLIAGRGKLPLILAQQIKKQGFELVVVDLCNKDKNLRQLTDEYFSFDLGQIQTIIDTLLTQEIKNVFMIGKVSKEIIFDRSKLDKKAIDILAKLKDNEDNTIMKAIVDELEDVGIKVLDQTQYLAHLLANKGVLTKKQPDANQWLDIEYGILKVKEIASLNIGQLVVVKDRTVLAVEAQEGSDETILRAGRLAKEGVVVKTSKPDHDSRFDIPTVGISTIHTMIKAKAAVLAIEEQKVLMVDKEEMIEKADDANIVIVGWGRE